MGRLPFITGASSLTAARPIIGPPTTIFGDAGSVKGISLKGAHVLIALVPAVFCALYFFGLPALWVMLVSVSTCVGTEWLITKYMLRRPLSINDYSAVLTGVLLALNLPSNLPLWMVAVGAVVAIGIAKMAFGGLGCNIFNPALVGRVFLFISFSAAMSIWPLPDAGFGDADGATGATILSLVKMGQSTAEFTPHYHTYHKSVKQHAALGHRRCYIVRGHKDSSKQKSARNNVYAHRIAGHNVYKG